ncbi:MoeB/ThiF family adenylyltransferase [Radiobacillus sp. PE A8.2]|uniref:MoeB/ThiF family adenylyltransferase n=1 Tax=Radiobacillus sp. PE A8.2 TaxID=3380349 RepID=UPI00388E5E52
MDDRYSRQTLFKPIGLQGQQLLADKHLLIVGAGALGTANAEALVRSGVGYVTIVDRDYVEASNLQRQQLYTEQDAVDRLPKAVAIEQRLKAINSTVDITGIVIDITAETLVPLVQQVDLIIDATDNFDVRLLINDVAQKYNIPWIYGSCVASTGMSYTIIPGKTPCLQCLLGAAPMSGATCDTAGIITPVVQMVAAHQTAETLKILSGNQDVCRDTYVTFDLWNNSYLTFNPTAARKKDCQSCGQSPTYPSLKYDRQTKTEVLCGRDTVQIRAQQQVSLGALAEKLAVVGEVKKNPYLVSVELDQYRVVFFKDGRAFVHGTNNIEEAKTVYYRLKG